MAFQDLWQGAKRFFGPDNPFFHGPQEDKPQQPADEMPAPQAEAPMPEPQPAYQQAPQQPYQQQPYPQQAPYQQAYQQPQQSYQQPQPQVQNAQQSPFQQGYRPPQQQNTAEPFVAPRNRRSQQHQQPQPQPQVDMNGNVVPFPGAQPQTAPQMKSPNACVINVRSIADCRNAIGILRSNDCVLAVMDSIADQAEVRRYVDTLNGACFSLGCTMTRLSARVGVYLLAPAGMNVYTDQATTQMNNQSRAPQRPQQPQRPAQPQQAFRPPYQQPQQPAYQQAPQQPYGQMSQGYQQPQQMNAPVFSAQSPAQGYSPDVNENEYNAI